VTDGQNKLRAIVSRWSGGLQAQLLELDIAVQGTDLDQILAEFSHAITVSYEIAMDLGEVPFLNLREPPKATRDRWRSCNRTPGSVKLTKEIVMALATALRWPKPKTRFNTNIELTLIKQGL
jgi:hypothetical protein